MTIRIVQSMTLFLACPDPKSEMQIISKGSDKEVRQACASSGARLSLSFDQTIFRFTLELKTGLVHCSKRAKLGFPACGGSMSAFERLLEPGCTESAACRCGKDMEVASIERLPEGSDAAVRIYHCSACHHEMRLTVWATVT